MSASTVEKTPDLELESLTSAISADKRPGLPTINWMYKESLQSLDAVWNMARNRRGLLRDTYPFCNSGDLGSALNKLRGNGESDISLIGRTSAVLIDLSKSIPSQSILIELNAFQHKEANHRLRIQRASSSRLPPVDGVDWTPFTSWDGALVCSLDDGGLEPALTDPSKPRAVKGVFQFFFGSAGEEKIPYESPLGVIVPLHIEWAKRSAKQSGVSLVPANEKFAPIWDGRVAFLTTYPADKLHVSGSPDVNSPRGTVSAKNVQRLS